jgi:hypothetical protein
MILFGPLRQIAEAQQTGMRMVAEAVALGLAHIERPLWSHLPG